MELALMESNTLLLMTVLVGLLTAWFIRRLVSRPMNLPPGPSWMQLLGSGWKIVRGKVDPLSVFSSWFKTYGEMVSFYVGPKAFVILNTYSVISEAFRHPDLIDRPKSQMREEMAGYKDTDTKDGIGVVLANGELWKDQRKFIHNVFRSLGVGKKSYEDTVAAEMKQLSAAIEDKKGSPFDPHVLLGQAVANIICSIVFGTQYKYDDDEFQNILQMLNTNLKLAGGGGAFFFLNFRGVSKVPFGTVKVITDNFRVFNAFVMSQIESHEKNLDQDNPKDFIDQYLNKVVETKDTNSTFNKLNLYICIGDLFIAGSETTTTTLKWCILFMTAFPDVQSRVQDELDHVVGRERLPRMNDSKDLPYTNAVLMEVQRKAAVVPLGVPHVAAADTTIRGYTIPKGATVLSNIWEVLNNDKLWEESDVFKPERFLTENGELIKRDELIFFCTGRRICLGEQLARMETFLGFTSLLHRFTFRKPDCSPSLSFEGVLGLTRSPQPYLTCAIPRD